MRVKDLASNRTVGSLKWSERVGVAPYLLKDEVLRSMQRDSLLGIIAGETVICEETSFYNRLGKRQLDTQI